METFHKVLLSLILLIFWLFGLLRSCWRWVLRIKVNISKEEAMQLGRIEFKRLGERDVEPELRVVERLRAYHVVYAHWSTSLWADVDVTTGKIIRSGIVPR